MVIAGRNDCCSWEVWLCCLGKSAVQPLHLCTQPLSHLCPYETASHPSAPPPTCSSVHQSTHQGSQPRSSRGPSY